MSAQTKNRCRWCGKPFVAEMANDKYCSPHCYEVAARVRGARTNLLAESAPIESHRGYESYLAASRKTNASILARYGAPRGAKVPQPMPHRRSE